MSHKVKDVIRRLAADNAGEAIAWRRNFHMHPELAFEEYETASFICERLAEMDIPFTKGVAGTGVVAMIQGRGSGSRVIGLRADMDALPITELNKVEYRSVNPGIMHACGHDMHMACLLGAAGILQQIRDELEGSVKLIFQPSEEKYPGGASVMIKEGVLENPRPDKMFGQHVLPTLDCGKIGMKSGMYMASTDEVFLTVKGRGGMPQPPS